MSRGISYLALLTMVHMMLRLYAGRHFTTAVKCTDCVQKVKEEKGRKRHGWRKGLHDAAKNAQGEQSTWGKAKNA